MIDKLKDLQFILDGTRPDFSYIEMLQENISYSSTLLSDLIGIATTRSEALGATMQETKMSSILVAISIVQELQSVALKQASNVLVEVIDSLDKQTIQANGQEVKTS